ncbi:hypothetical protein HNR00_001482 [Methylorubrum rhodinum]|uniref:Uncharacterized protein n=1 Tax=Methylorubrum rhodinum TaxID=29428 RepID=A0A840ZFQ2_9HYPH|nr:hypothetical protein [Methylorubrum rhodinum]
MAQDAQADQPDDDEVDRNDVVEEPQCDPDQDAGGDGGDRLEVGDREGDEMLSTSIQSNKIMRLDSRNYEYATIWLIFRVLFRFKFLNRV